ncbi:MAG: hypothetical protein E6R06_21530 [Mycobacterium sp.]|nr:MAG: hypothetical protein E6R06_21530 [Mycobacterium sp.]
MEHLLAERRYAYLNRRPKQPLIRLWDKNHDLIARIMIPESWDCEEKAHDDGDAHIELVGKDNDWLREIIVFKTRPAEDLHLTIDPDPDKPHDYKNRWGGKVTRIVDVEERGKPNITTLEVIHNRRHLSKFNLAATPLLPPAVQPIKMFLWGGPAASTCAIAMMVNTIRVYSLNAFWPVPRNILAPETWLENLSILNHPVQIMPINPLLDQSRWCTIGARWKDARTVLTPVMKDCGVICHAYTWLPGDPPPYSSVFGDELGEILKPTRACVILSFENDSGVTGPTGTAVDGLLNLFAATADDLITEALFPVDGDGDGETDPLIRKILGVAPKRPPYVYRDVGYGGANRREMTIHKSQAIIINTGGRSPRWVNMAITWGIRYGLSQIANAISSVPGAPAQVTGSEGLDNLYQGQFDDTLLSFINFIDPIRSADVGPYAFQEHFETGSGSAFTINSVFTLREGWWKTRPYVSFKFDVGDGDPFVLGEDIRLGSQVVAERRNVLYRDQIMAVRRQGNRRQSSRPQLSFGDDSREEDPMAQGFAAIANVANFAAMLAGSGDMF